MGITYEELESLFQSSNILFLHTKLISGSSKRGLITSIQDSSLTAEAPSSGISEMKD